MPTKQPISPRALSTSHDNISSQYSETPRGRQKSPQPRNKAFGALVDTSTTMGSGSHVDRKADNDHDLKEDFTAAKVTLADKRKFTLPLSVIFFLECALIIVALVVIVAVSQDRITTTFKDMIRTNIRSSLAYAATEVSSPITGIERVLLDYRTGLLIEEVLNYGYKPCGDYSVDLIYANRALSDMATIVRSYPSVLLLYTARISSMVTFDNPQGTPQLNMCAATPSEIRKVTAGKNEVSLRPVAANEFFDLDAVPRGSKPESELDLDAAYATLTHPLITWAPTVEQDPVTNTTILTLAGSVPIQVNRTNLTTGISDIYTPEPGEVSPAGVTLQALDSIGMAFSMASFDAVMKAITDDDPGAHTSLYDVLGGTLLCTSLSGFRQFDPSNRMWPSGNTPSSSLNNAFSAVDASTLTLNNPQIVFQKDTVVSATVVTTPFGVRFMIVRSTPRSYYFSTIDTVRNMMITIGVLAIVLTVGTATIIAYSIQAGVSKVKDNMEVAAALRNERVVPSHSLIAEINALCIAFDRMNDKLIVARAYLPQHLLVSTDDSALEDDEGEGEYGHAEDANSATAHRSRNMSEVSHSQAPMPAPATEAVLAFDGVNFVENDNLTLPAAANLTSKDTRKEAISRLPPTGANGLATKRVTILSVNARGFHADINVFAPNTAIEPTNDITDTISNICNRERGVIDSFHGDHFVLSFNAARQNAEGPQKAARCAMDIIAAHEGLMEFSMGLSTGKACVGHLGTATLKRLSIIGEVYSRAMANERMCRLSFSSKVRGASMIQHVDGEVTVSSDAIQCLADGIIAAEIQHTCLLQLLGAQPPAPQEVAQAAKLQQQMSDNPNVNVANVPIPAERLLYGIRGSVKKSGAKDGDEWLYEINHNSSPFLSQVNASMMAYLTATRAAALTSGPVDFIGGPSEAQNRLLNEVTAIRKAIAGKASASFVMDADPAKLGLGSSGVQQGGASPSPLLKEEAICHSAIQYATSVATARPQVENVAGLIGSK
eukprot:GILI01008191.1.p1 GENE.GILI01008191.1~~GILI01008191.1.p1  ORF type:complete len:1019 (+),score=207.57 GILI01008191.1:51-3059(+)